MVVGWDQLAILTRDFEIDGKEVNSRPNGTVTKETCTKDAAHTQSILPLFRKKTVQRAGDGEGKGALDVGTHTCPLFERRPLSFRDRRLPLSNACTEDFLRITDGPGIFLCCSWLLFWIFLLPVQQGAGTTFWFYIKTRTSWKREQGAHCSNRRTRPSLGIFKYIQLHSLHGIAFWMQKPRLWEWTFKPLGHFTKPHEPV